MNKANTKSHTHLQFERATAMKPFQSDGGKRKYNKFGIEKHTLYFDFCA